MQGAGGAFVERIDGSPSNVIGLPLTETIAVLRACGVTVARQVVVAGRHAD
jgi:septum formation protein